MHLHFLSFLACGRKQCAPTAWFCELGFCLSHGVLEVSMKLYIGKPHLWFFSGEKSRVTILSWCEMKQFQGDEQPLFRGNTFMLLSSQSCNSSVFLTQSVSLGSGKVRARARLPKPGSDVCLVCVCVHLAARWWPRWLLELLMTMQLSVHGAN